jgi:hypothetical protein
VTSETNGLVVSGAGTLAETRLVADAGVKQYSEANGDFTITATSWTTERAIAVPYKDINGTPRMNFNFVMDRGSEQSISAVDFTFSGVTFKNQAEFDQACAIVARGTGLTNIRSGFYGFAQDNTSTVSVNGAASASIRYISVSGDIELESWPTWADFDGSVMFGTEAQAQNTRFSATSNNGQTVANQAAVLYEDVEKDTAGNYDDTTGIYTITSAGDYQSSASVRLNAASSIRISIQKNGVDFRTSPASTEYTSVSALLPNLEVGDEIRVINDVGGSVTLRTNSDFNFFDLFKVTTKSSKATGFPFADQIPGEYGMVKANGLLQKSSDSAYTTTTSGILSITQAPEGKYKVTVGANYYYGDANNEEAVIIPQLNNADITVPGTASTSWTIGHDDDGAVETENYIRGFTSTLIIDFPNATNSFDLDIQITSGGILSRPWYILEKLENVVEITTEWD